MAIQSPIPQNLEYYTAHYFDGYNHIRELLEDTEQKYLVDYPDYVLLMQTKNPIINLTNYGKLPYTAYYVYDKDLRHKYTEVGYSDFGRTNKDRVYINSLANGSYFHIGFDTAAGPRLMLIWVNSKLTTRQQEELIAKWLKERDPYIENNFHTSSIVIYNSFGGILLIYYLPATSNTKITLPEMIQSSDRQLVLRSEAEFSHFYPKNNGWYGIVTVNPETNVITPLLFDEFIGSGIYKVSTTNGLHYISIYDEPITTFSINTQVWSKPTDGKSLALYATLKSSTDNLPKEIEVTNYIEIDITYQIVYRQTQRAFVICDAADNIYVFATTLTLEKVWNYIRVIPQELVIEIKGITFTSFPIQVLKVIKMTLMIEDTVTVFIRARKQQKLSTSPPVYISRSLQVSTNLFIEELYSQIHVEDFISGYNDRSTSLQLPELVIEPILSVEQKTFADFNLVQLDTDCTDIVIVYQVSYRTKLDLVVGEIEQRTLVLTDNVVIELESVVL